MQGAPSAPQQTMARSSSSGAPLLYVVNGRNLLVFSYPDGALIARQNDIGSLRGACRILTATSSPFC